MRWLALETGDAATWGSTVITFGMACYAIAQGMSQKRDLRRQNELQAEASQLQRRQIETAERRTMIMEDLLHRVSAAAWPAPPEPPRAWTGSVPAQEPGSSFHGAPPPPPAGDEGVSDVGAGPAQDVPEADLTEEDGPYPDFPAGADPGPPARTVPAVPPGGYGGPQPPHPGSVPAGANPPGDTSSDARSAGTGRPSPSVPPSAWVPLQQAAPAGPWRLERFRRHSFALRNTGTRTLTGVRVGRANLPPSARGVPEAAVVRPGETVEFVMASERGRKLPATLAVSWHGHHGEEHVPVPPG